MPPTRVKACKKAGGARRKGFAAFLYVGLNAGSPLTAAVTAFVRARGLNRKGGGVTQVGARIPTRQRPTQEIFRMQITGHRLQVNQPVPADVGPRDHNAVEPNGGEVAVKIASSPPRANQLNFTEFLRKYPERVESLDKTLKGRWQQDLPIEDPLAKQGFGHLPYIVEKLVKLNDDFNDVAERGDVKALLGKHFLVTETITKTKEAWTINLRVKHFCDACYWLEDVRQPIIKEACYELLAEFLGLHHGTFGDPKNVFLAFGKLEQLVFSPNSLRHIAAQLTVLRADWRRSSTRHLLDLVAGTSTDSDDELRADILTALAAAPYIPVKLEDMKCREFQKTEVLFERQMNCAMKLPNHLRFPVMLALEKALGDTNIYKMSRVLQEWMRELEDECNIDQLKVIQEECRGILQGPGEASETQIAKLCKQMAIMNGRYVPLALGEIFGIANHNSYGIFLAAIVDNLSTRNRFAALLWLADRTASLPRGCGVQPALPTADLELPGIQLRRMYNDVSELLGGLRENVAGDELSNFVLSTFARLAVDLRMEERVDLIHVLIDAADAASSPKCYSASAACLQHVEPKVRFDLARRLMKAAEDFPVEADRERAEVCHSFVKFYSKPPAKDQSEFLRYVTNLGVHVARPNIEKIEAYAIFQALQDSLPEYRDDKGLQRKLEDESIKILDILFTIFPNTRMTEPV
ncbi:MAG: hypothetical protein EON54_02195 [Alcaligenaceae bacterium]|nr:MAG: hypothetical protein EON54_02195 [Alcaligenaceae bacterium]